MGLVLCGRRRSCLRAATEGPGACLALLANNPGSRTVSCCANLFPLSPMVTDSVDSTSAVYCSVASFHHR